MEKAKIMVANTCEPCSFTIAIFSFPYSLSVGDGGYGNLLMWCGPAMDTDKIKIFGARLKVDGTGKLAELERAEKV